MKRKRKVKLKNNLKTRLLLMVLIVSIFGCAKNQSISEFYDSANETLNSANQQIESVYELYDSASSTINELTDKYLSEDASNVTVLERSRLVIDKPDDEITTNDILALDFESQTTVAGLFERFPKYALEIPESHDLYQVEGQERLIQSLLLDKPD